VVVENKPGASGILGTEHAARAPADGHTLLVGNISTLAVNAATFARLPYDPLTSFVPVSMLAIQPLVVAVHPKVQARTLADLVRLAKAQPRHPVVRLGRQFHPSRGRVLQQPRRRADEPRAVQGAAHPRSPTSWGGQIDVLFDPFSSLYPQVQAGKVRGTGRHDREPVSGSRPTCPR
jgi:tripartite-type tricarboxylate transporter receptor subunit TctC